MPTGKYDHSKNKGFTGKKHTEYSKSLMSEGHISTHQRKREEEKKEK